ncbi:MAG: GMC family oxidoreductase N-terminal domain-containing protein [Hyphomicrobiaceae bacterium]
MKDYDYIVVGAGSAGAVLASRLSENPRNQVLLVEAGGDTHFLSRFPISFGLFIEKPGVNWLYQSTPEANTGNREIPVPRGKMLGGSSAVNGLRAGLGEGSRSNRRYNTWAQMGAKGWSWQDVAPVFTRIEGYEKGGRDGRGKDGPLRISEVPDQSPLYDALFKAAEASGYKLNHDYNSEGPGSGQDAKRASGTDCAERRQMPGARPQTGESHHSHQRAYAPREARWQAVHGHRLRDARQRSRGQCPPGRDLVCRRRCDAANRHELSGIGNPACRSMASTCSMRWRRWAGENFRDHLNVRRLIWPIKQKSLSLQSPGCGRWARAQVHVLARWGSSVCCIRAHAGVPQEPAPTWRRLTCRCIVPYSIKGSEDEAAAGFPVDVDVVLPAATRKSRHHHIRSRNRDQPEIRFNPCPTLSISGRWWMASKIVRKIVGPSWTNCAARVCAGKKVQSDDEILEYIRTTAQTAYHPIGTCRMGPEGRNTVVDERLRVHGIKGLHVADASIFPTMPSATPMRRASWWARRRLIC